MQKGRIQDTVVAAVAILATLDDHIGSNRHERPVSELVRVKGCRIGNSNIYMGVGAHNVLLEWVHQLLVAAHKKTCRESVCRCSSSLCEQKPQNAKPQQRKASSTILTLCQRSTGSMLRIRHWQIDIAIPGGWQSRRPG